MDSTHPRSSKGVLAILALVLIAVLAFFASTWGGIAIIAIVVAVATWIVYAIGIRIHRILLGG